MKILTYLFNLLGFVPNSQANVMTEEDVNEMAKRYDPEIIRVNGIKVKVWPKEVLLDRVRQQQKENP